MARKVKCLYCKKDGNTDIFHRESIKGKNRYFCNTVEYEIYELNEQKKREITEQRNELIKWVVEEYYDYDVGMVFPKTLTKRMTPLFNFYPVNIVKETFINNHELISWAMKNKGIDNEFGKTCYIMSVIESSINDVYLKYKQLEKQQKKVEEKNNELDLSFINEEIITKDTIKTNNDSGISRFLSMDDM